MAYAGSRAASAAQIRHHASRKVAPHKFLSGIALALTAGAYVCAPYVDFAAIGKPAPVAITVTLAETTLSEAHGLAPEFLAHRPLGFAPKMFAHSAPLSSRFQWSARVPDPTQVAVRTVHSVPLPVPRPADLGSLNGQTPTLQAMLPPKAPRSEDPFRKLLPSSDGVTAIYDITARTVYLPDGTRLEAHSGLGEKMDDPRHVNVRMHGATPPHVYDLAPREALFHGDEALRMHPVGGAEAIFGRTGLLTHSYLLGPNGQSNGCVSFRDYEAFLNAYKSGKVKRLVVVASADDPQMDMALLERPAPKIARAPAPAVTRTASFRIEDDRYLSAFSSSRASRTSSSARSFN